jgi:hypothetical protein
MTADVYVCIDMYPSFIHSKSLLRLGASGDAGTFLGVHVTRGTAAAEATATCDFAVRLFATCEQNDLLISGGNLVVPPPISSSLLPREPKLSSNCYLEVHDLERRPVPCNRDHVTT